CVGAAVGIGAAGASVRFVSGSAAFVGVLDGRHVGFESWLERDHVMALDFDPAVGAIASQPFWLLWPAAEGTADDTVRAARHAARGWPPGGESGPPLGEL